MEFYMPPENDGASPPAPEPKYVTAEEIGNIVNSAVTSQLKRSLGGAIDAALKPVTEKLATLSHPAPEGEKKSKQDPELLAMSKQIEDMKKELQQREERAVTAEKKAREERAYNDVRNMLSDKVRPELLDFVAKHLMVVEQRVDFDEAGTPLFKSRRAPYPGGELEDQALPLKAGIEDFLKSDSAKAFLPAPSSGSGASPLPKRTAAPVQSGIDFSKPATSDADKLRRAAERVRIAREKLGNQP